MQKCEDELIKIKAKEQDLTYVQTQQHNDIFLNGPNASCQPVSNVTYGFFPIIITIKLFQRYAILSLHISTIHREPIQCSVASV